MENKKPEDVVDFYNHYVERQKRHGVNERHISILEKVKIQGLKHFDNVLEIGCGIGTETKLLSMFLKQGKIYACDISPENIKTAREALSQIPNITLEIQDATNFCLSTKFDVIVMPDVIEHIPLDYHARMFQNMSKMLKPDGFIFIHIPNPEYLSWCHENRKEILQIVDQPIYPEVLLKNIQETDLVITHMETYSIWVEKGDYQYIVLRKKTTDYSEYVEKKISVWEKIKYKLHGKNQ